MLIEILLAYGFWTFVFFTLFSLWTGFSSMSEPLDKVLSSVNNLYAATSTYQKFVDRELNLKTFERLQNPRYKIQYIDTAWQDSIGSKSCRGLNTNELVEDYSLSLGLEERNELSDAYIRNNTLYVVTNSASTSDPDLYIFNIENPRIPQMITSINSGPGLSRLIVAGNTVFVADTSSINQVQAFSFVDDTLSLKWKYAVPGAHSSTSPITKRIFYASKKLYIGTEKTVLPEIYVVDVSGQFPRLLASAEVGASVNDIFVKRDNVFLLTPLDLEIKVLDAVSLTEKTSYDSEGHLGNGKRIDAYNDELLFGRTLGGEELEHLSVDSTTQNIVRNYSYKLKSSVDDIVSSKDYIYVLTADQQKELQVFKKDQAAFVYSSSVDLPQRATSFTCSQDKMYVVLPHEIKVYKAKNKYE
ncbi:MAG: hypothetical protein RL094_334 [Candidatus Parcubacteria bacterium]